MQSKKSSWIRVLIATAFLCFLIGLGYGVTCYSGPIRDTCIVLGIKPLDTALFDAQYPDDVVIGHPMGNLIPQIRPHDYHGSK